MRARAPGASLLCSFRCGTASDIPVSYTHLDVYKRQVYVNKKAVFDGSGEKKYVYTVNEDGYRNAVEVTVGDTVDDYTAVSYTHLDVYKRQTKNRALLDIGAGSLQISIFDKQNLIQTQNLPIGAVSCLLYTSRCV